MTAADAEEWFDLVTEEDMVCGRELRSVCHAKGLLHRAVYAWVFRPDGRLLIQRRSPHKKIGPGQWDLSVAEHLQPGESYLEGAVRGLQEELGIAAEAAQLAGPLAPTHRRELHQGDFHDCELVQSYRLDGYSGPVQVDEGEVAEAKWVPLRELQARAEAHPEQYTQWFLDEMRSLGWFQFEAATAGEGAAEAAEPCVRQPAACETGQAAAEQPRQQQHCFSAAM